jgi:hypothetical protein
VINFFITIVHGAEMWWCISHCISVHLRRQGSMNSMFHPWDNACMLVFQVTVQLSKWIVTIFLTMEIFSMNYWWRRWSDKGHAHTKRIDWSQVFKQFSWSNHSND